MIPRFGQVSEYLSKVVVNKQACDVLQKDESGLSDANDVNRGGPLIAGISLGASPASA